MFIIFDNLEIIDICMSTFFTEYSFYSSATTPGQSGPWSDGNEFELRIPQSSSITGTSLSDCLVPYPGHSLVGVLSFCRGAIRVFYSPGRLGKNIKEKLAKTVILNYSNVLMKYLSSSLHDQKVTIGF